MTDYRLMQPHELAEAARLSDSVFRPHTLPSMSDLFPPLFSPGVAHSYGAFADSRALAAFMGLAPSTLRVGGAAVLRAFSIGSVCTAPEQRGAGLAGRLLELSIAHARQAGAPLLFVSGARPLYTRAGSAAFGRAAQIVLRPAEAAAPGGLSYRLREARPQDLPGLHALHRAGDTHVEESAAGLGERIGAAAFCGVLGLAQRVILAEAGEEPAAYAVLGVPPGPFHSLGGEADRLPVRPGPGAEAAAGTADTPSGNPPTVIAYGGNPQAAAWLLASLPDACGLNELHVHVPWQERELEARLLQTPGAAGFSVPNAGTLLVTDVRLLLDQAYDLWLLPWTEALRVDEEGRVFTASGGRELSRSEWYSVLFDPNSPRLGDIPGWFEPIPLPYVYGLHYI